MFWTILALSMTVLMGGIIAYNGDLIGRKFGKRRVSLFGLRPKHTAILITSVTGVIISGLTTGVMFLLVPQVREIILDGERAIRDNSRLLKDADAKRIEIRNLGIQIAAAHTDRSNALSELSRTRGDLATVRGDLSKARSLVAVAEERLMALGAQNSSLQARNSNLTRVNTDLAGSNVELAEHNRGLVRQNAGLERTKTQLVRQVAVKQEDNRRIDEENQRLAKENEAQIRQNLALTGEIERRTGVIERQTLIQREHEQAINAQQGKIRDQSAKLDEQAKLISENEAKYSTLLRQGRDLFAEYEQLQRRFETLRTRKVAVHSGEDLARIVIPANASPSVVRKALDRLLQDADMSASTKGARSGSAASLRSIQVVDKQFLAQTVNGGLVPVSVSETDRVNALVNRLSLSESPVCVLAIAVANSVESEPAAIDFQPYNDWLVYPKGRVIATRRVSGRDAPERLFPDLMTFFREVGQTAIERGLIPRIDPVSGNPEVGSLNWPELVRVVEQVRGNGGWVRVIARAAEDTNASDPLRLEVKVESSL